MVCFNYLYIRLSCQSDEFRQSSLSKYSLNLSLVLNGNVDNLAEPNGRGIRIS